MKHVDILCGKNAGFLNVKAGGTHRHHHKHQGLDPLIRSVSKVTTALSNVSSVYKLFSFFVVSSGMITEGFGFVELFASVETSSVCIRLSCLVCL